MLYNILVIKVKYWASECSLLLSLLLSLSLPEKNKSMQNDRSRNTHSNEKVFINCGMMMKPLQEIIQVPLLTLQSLFPILINY